MRKRIKIELVSSDIRLQKLINRSTFKHCTTYSENLNAVLLENKIIDFCKPIYIGKYTFKLISKHSIYYIIFYLRQVLQCWKFPRP